ncbi:hypothetical protein ACFLRN_07885 [Thermoproteota archaeon]
MSLLTVSVAAYVYESVQNNVTQTVQEIATLTLGAGALGTIEEGETKVLTAITTPALNDIVSITTSKNDVYLYFDTDLDTQITNYATYQIVVKVGDTVPGTSSYNTGDTFTTLSIASPDTASGVALDIAGPWTFDFEITTTADSVSSNQDTTVSVTVTAQSTT